jgi:S-adenosylmethionine:diacylglycerol 3-amino-3-carboxypropyl transferase
MSDDTTAVGFGGELTATIDKDEMSAEQREMYEQMAAIFADNFETFVQKNLDYDSSFVSAGEVDQVFDSGDGPFDSAVDANLYKVFTRIQDKDQRFYSQVFCNNDDRVGESALETATDAAVYWFMVAWLLSCGRDNSKTHIVEADE